MTRRLLPPEEATSWEDFQDRYRREWSYRNNRPRSLRYGLHVAIGMFLLIVAFVFFTYATGKHGMGWRWLGVALPIVIVAMMLVRAWRLGSRDGARLKELERLKQDWQERAEHGEIPHTGSKPRAPRRDRRGRVTCAAADQERP